MHLYIEIGLAATGVKIGDGKNGESAHLHGVGCVCYDARNLLCKAVLLNNLNKRCEHVGGAISFCALEGAV